MKYKVGDEFTIKITDIDENFEYPYIFEEIGFAMSENDLNSFEQTMTAEETWEIAKKVFLYPSQGGFNTTELEEIFGRTEHLWEMTPQEAKAKIQAWEAEKEIKVGDVVIETSGAGSEYTGVVTQITSAQKSVCIVYSDGSTNITLVKNIKKTGRHIDIDGLLKHIGDNKA